MSPSKTLNRIFFAFLVIYLGLPGLPRDAVGQEAQEQIREEINRLQELVSSHFSTDEKARKAGENYRQALEKAEGKLGTGYLYAALQQLSSIQKSLLPTVYQLTRADVANSGMEAFEKEWQHVGQELEEKQAKLEQKATLPAGVRAMAEASINQSEPYYQSSRLYSRNTSVNSGLYYLGRSSAQLEFAIFCQHLRFPPMPPPPALRPLTKEVEELESKVVAGYQEAGFGKAEKERRYNRFIATNMTIKMVREAEQANLSFGALYKYLEALLHFHLIDRAAPTVDQLATLKAVSLDMEPRLSITATDHSIGLYFWQLAQTDLDNATWDKFDGESLRRSAVILDTILPSYFRITDSMN
jgi:hypothetical protein